MKYCQGPAPDTKSPNFTAPPGACDAHCHVFGPAAVFPFAEGRSYTPPDSPFEAFQDLQKTLGLERAVIVQATCHGTDNTVTLDAIERSNGRYRGVALVDESFTDDDYKRLDDGGIREFGSPSPVISAMRRISPGSCRWSRRSHRWGGTSFFTWKRRTSLRT